MGKTMTLDAQLAQKGVDGFTGERVCTCAARFDGGEHTIGCAHAFPDVEPAPIYLAPEQRRPLQRQVNDQVRATLERVEGMAHLPSQHDK